MKKWNKNQYYKFVKMFPRIWLKSRFVLLLFLFFYFDKDFNPLSTITRTVFTYHRPGMTLSFPLLWDGKLIFQGLQTNLNLQNLAWGWDDCLEVCISHHQGKLRKFHMYVQIFSLLKNQFPHIWGYIMARQDVIALTMDCLLCIGHGVRRLQNPHQTHCAHS